VPRQRKERRSRRTSTRSIARSRDRLIATPLGGYYHVAHSELLPGRTEPWREQGQDWGLRATVLSDMARQAIYQGRIDDGLSLIELSQVRQGRLTATVRAMLSTVQARALAAADRPSGALSAIGQAEDHFVDSDPAGDP